MGSAPSGYQTPKTNWAAGDIPTAQDFNRIENNIRAIDEGSRTIEPTQVPSGNTGTLRQLLDWFANRIKAILGTTNWYDSPPTTLQAAKSHINAAAPHSGHETPSGAQAKAAAALEAAKQYTDQAVSIVSQDLMSHKNDKAAHIDYAIADGTDTYTVEIPGITAYVEGMSLKIKFQNANTGPSTLNINGLGDIAIKKSNGNDLSAGYIKSGRVYHLVYDGVNFQLLGEGGEYGTAQPEHVLEGYTIGTENGIVQGTMPNQGKVIITPSTVNIAIPRGFHDGTGYVQGSANLIPENIKEGVNVFGVIGTLTPLRSASGTKDITSDYTTISGLPFRPKFIIVEYSYWTSSGGNWINNIFESIYVYSSSYTIRTRGTGEPSIVDTSPFTLYDDGFRFRLPSSYADTIIANECQATWNAWG